MLPPFSFVKRQFFFIAIKKQVVSERKGTFCLFHQTVIFYTLLRMETTFQAVLHQIKCFESSILLIFSVLIMEVFPLLSPVLNLRRKT